MWPFRKAWRAVKSVFRRKRKARKVVRRRRVANSYNGLVRVKKTKIDNRIAVAANGTIFATDTFELQDLTEFASYVALYEEYRITRITYSFKALNNTASVPNGAVGFVSTLGMIHTIIDTNDSAAPVSIQQMMNDSTYRGSVSSRNHTRSFTPKWLNVLGGSVPDQSKTGWLNTSSTNVSHYGIKWAFEGGVASGPLTSFYVEPIITYHLSFRNPQ